jgi:ketosteroid isomerase-like protein
MPSLHILRKLAPIIGRKVQRQILRRHFTIDDEFTLGQNTDGQNTDVQTEVTRWTITGTHEGELTGIPPTGRRISITGISIARIANGKIIESWNNWDALGLMQQLGVVSTETAEPKGRVA